MAIIHKKDVENLREQNTNPKRMTKIFYEFFTTFLIESSVIIWENFIDFINFHISDHLKQH